MGGNVEIKGATLDTGAGTVQRRSTEKRPYDATSTVAETKRERPSAEDRLPAPLGIIIYLRCSRL